MPDRGARYADKSIVKVTRSLKKTYAQAQKELESKLKDFNARFKAKDKEKQRQRDAGEITEQQYKDWLSGQVFIRNQWESKIRQVNAVMLDYNKQAMNIVNNSRFDVFAENYYSEAFRAQWIVNDLSWNVYNSQALAQLIKDDPQILPEWKIDEEKDYKWNYQKVNNIIKQGIIQGESVEQITKRLCTDLSAMNENKMRMFARTGITEAQNAGRQEQMRQAAEELDIEQEKEWQATFDNRTRDAHRHLDGQRVSWKDSFQSDLGEIKYPGDPTADPANVYNCRCTMKTIYPKYEDRSKNFRENVTIDGQSYEEWKEGKQKNGDIVSFAQYIPYKSDLINAEKALSKNNQVETAICLDRRTGRTLFTKTSNLRDHVYFTADEMRMMRDQTMTHNHPDNGTLSIEDVKTSYNAGVREVRAKTDYKVYSLVRQFELNEPIPREYSDFGFDYEEYYNKCKEKVDKIFDKTHNANRCNRLLNNKCRKWLIKNAEGYGWKYTEESVIE